MAYGDLKDLAKISHKVLCDEAFIIKNNPKYDGYHCSLVQIVYKLFDKKTAGDVVKSTNILNKQLAEELHKPILEKFDKRKVYSSFIDNVWGADLANMQLIIKFNKGFHFYYLLLMFIVDMHGLFV